MGGSAWPGEILGLQAGGDTCPFTAVPACQDDLSFAGYQKHLSSCAAPAPLTSAEQELQQIRINEVGLAGMGRPRLQGRLAIGGRRGGHAYCHPPQVKTEISVESKHQTLQGLAFPLQPAAQRALQQLQQRAVNYIQLVGLTAHTCPACPLSHHVFAPHGPFPGPACVLLGSPDMYLL